ncbi:hypothetical protein BD779DRAFT_1486498 [Infundibulicybe gibba]|nr:hypothetical protein BD779DRAFT_1486498 [Infundibulicybe gibba]
MTTRVQKGGPIFRPIVKSRTRAAENVRQPSVPIEARSAAHIEDTQHDGSANTPAPPPRLSPEMSMRTTSDPSTIQPEQTSSDTYVKSYSHTITPSPSQTLLGPLAQSGNCSPSPPHSDSGDPPSLTILPANNQIALPPGAIPSNDAPESSPNTNAVLTYVESDLAEPVVSQAAIEEPTISHKAKRRKDPPINDLDETEPPRKKNKNRSSNIDPTTITMATYAKFNKPCQLESSKQREEGAEEEDETSAKQDSNQDVQTDPHANRAERGNHNDEESLVVDRAEGENTENYTHVVESDTTKFVNSGTYGKRFRGSDGAQRKQRSEDKKNHARIDYCLKNSIPVDIKTLSRMTGKDFSGPTPEIRAPQKHTKKKSRSKSVGAKEGEVIIGDRDGFDSS